MIMIVSMVNKSALWFYFYAFPLGHYQHNGIVSLLMIMVMTIMSLVVTKP